VLQNGGLYVEMPHVIPPWLVFGPERYCIDTFVVEDSDGAKTTQLDALLCFAEKEEEHYYLLSSTCK
jgi:hypothetical protein